MEAAGVCGGTQVGRGVRESWGWGLELYLPPLQLALEMPRVIPPDPTPIHPSFPSRALELSGDSALRAGTLSCHCRSQNPRGQGWSSERVRTPTGAWWKSDPDRGAGYEQMEEDSTFQAQGQ